MARYEGFLAQHWATLQQAALYQPEPNPSFRNPSFEAAPYRALIVRLSPFRDVNRSTPHLFLFQAVRRALPEAYVDMAFFPPEHDRARWLAEGVPLLLGTQSWRDASDFDVVLVSNSYTLELINLPYLLLNSGTAVYASQRAESWPILILGGSNALAVQAVVTPDGDCMADALFFGEGEREVETLIQELHARQDLPKQARLRQAAERVTGLWVANSPSEQRVTKAVCRRPQAPDLLVDYPSLNSEEASTARLQTSFGCPAFCTFCFEGYDRKPYREIALADIITAAEDLKRRQGVEAVDIYSFNFNTHEEILALLLELNRRFERVHVKSQRVDLLAVMPSLLEAEVTADKRSFTLGIEGVSGRMRRFLRKSLADKEIEAVLVRSLQEKIREIKLFYILTGHETEDDLEEFHQFARRLRAWRQSYSRGLRIVFSFGLLVRMPFTPLRHDRLFLDEEAWRPILGSVKSSCETNGFEFRMATTWDEYAASQVLSLGGTWLHKPVTELAEAGHVYDLHLTPRYWEALRDWMVENGQWHEGFLGEKPRDWPFALDFVDMDVSTDFLYRQYLQAIQGVDQGYCLGEVGSPAGVGEPGICLGCGACTTPAERSAIIQHTMRHPGFGYQDELEATMRRKWREQPVYARVWLPRTVARAEPAWLNAFVMRSILETHPGLVDNLLSVQESLFATKANTSRYTGLFGATVVGVRAWDISAVRRCLSVGDVLPGGLRFLGFLDEFEPGGFTRMHLHLTLPLAHFPDAGRQLRRYLQAQYVPVNLRGTARGYAFDIPEKALKKRVLFAGHYEEVEGQLEAGLVVSPKFDLVGYLKSFPDPRRYREGLAEVQELVL
ncbi:MAG: radical SAM protein [Anaerolineae bacterium]